MVLKCSYSSRRNETGVANPCVLHITEAAKGNYGTLLEFRTLAYLSFREKSVFVIFRVLLEQIIIMAIN